MMQLIVTVIAIALVGALAGASIYYGGDAFTSGNSKAQASQAINAAQQISASWTLHRADRGTDPTAATVNASHDLVTTLYLQTAPLWPAGFTTPATAADVDTATAGNQGGVTASVAATASDTCLRIAQMATPGTSVTAIPTTQPTTTQYGCYGSAAPYTFFYKK